MRCQTWKEGGFKTPAPSHLPAPDLNLVLEAPITTWDEAIPLGNGLLGGLLWRQGNLLRLSLDRGDLWDERPADGVAWQDFNYATMGRLVAAGRNDELNRIFDKPYDARRENGVTTWFRIVAGHDGIVRVRDNFGGRSIRWNVSVVRQADATFEVRARRGDTIEATLK